MVRDNKSRFIDLCMKIKRDGMYELLEWVKNSDFFSAPASTRYHSSHEGGLLEHSLSVAECLFNKLHNPVWVDRLSEVGRESLIISALLHDICKTYYYGTELRNKKIYSEHGSKRDSNGRFDWETVPSYIVEDKIPYGHGEKSVMMIEEFISLKPVERYAIRWHMGFTEPKENWGTLGEAIKKYPLVLALHEADIESTYLLEKEE